MDTTQKILGRIGIAAEVTWNEERASVPMVSIMSQDSLGTLIGKQGANLVHLEHLIRLVAMRRNEKESSARLTSFVVDVNNYRKHHIEHILGLAKEVARRVSQNRRAESMSPMSSYERRAIHAELTSYKDVTTESVGQEPQRRVMVSPALEFNSDLS